MSDRILTPEVEKRLQSYAPITPKGEWNFIPSGYLEAGIPKSDCPRFRLRELSSDEVVSAPALSDQSEKEFPTRFGLFVLHCVRHGLLGWENWKADGKEVAFERRWRQNRELAQEAIEMIPPALLYELGGAIASGARLAQEEAEGL